TEWLGEGGMGIVYKARKREAGAPLVALKKMKHFDPAALDRFQREVDALMNVNHPNVVSLYDVISDGEQWFFTMELVEGRPFPGHLSPTEGFESMTVDDPSLAGGDPFTP